MGKKIIIALVILTFVMSGSAFAQKLTYIQVGTFKPKATDSGLILGLGTAKEFDERVELGLTIDLFIKEYTDEQEFYQEDTLDPNAPPIPQVTTNYESTVTMIPLMGNVIVKFPIEFPIIPYAGGAIGYTLVWYKFNNYDADIKDTQFFSGFSYRLMAGGLYPLGSRSAFLAEIFINGSKPSHKEDADAGKPVRSEIDMSGLGFRIGFRLGGFGFF